MSLHWILVLHHLLLYRHVAQEKTCTFCFLPRTSAALFPFPIASQSLDPIPTGQPTRDTLNVGLTFSLEDICNKVQITDLSPSQRHRVSSTTSEMAAVAAVAMLWRKSSWCRQLQFYRQTKREQGKKQNHNPRLQESRLWPVHTSAWKNLMGYSPG